MDTSNIPSTIKVSGRTNVSFQHASLSNARTKERIPQYIHNDDDEAGEQDLRSLVYTCLFVCVGMLSISTIIACLVW